MLARRWTIWLTGAVVSFLLWMGLMALAMTYRSSAPFGLQIAAGISFALACAAGSFFVMSACLRFGTRRSRILDNLADSAFGMYLVHYGFVVWLQYALLGVALFAIAKAMIVLGATLLLAWATTTALSSVPLGSRLIGVKRRVGIGAILPGGLRPTGAGMGTTIGTSVCRTLNGNNRTPFAEVRDAIDS
jgi:peptidoglycan/LPS O-acetylase OafA/YrhL